MSTAAAEMIDRLRAWLVSPEGKAAMLASQEATAAMIAELQRERRVDPDDLRRPMTV